MPLFFRLLLLGGSVLALLCNWGMFELYGPCFTIMVVAMIYCVHCCKTPEILDYRFLIVGAVCCGLSLLDRQLWLLAFFLACTCSNTVALGWLKEF